MSSFESINHYKHTIRENLKAAHDCPYEIANKLMEKHHEAVNAFFSSGLPPADLILWFDLEWKSGLS